MHNHHDTYKFFPNNGFTAGNLPKVVSVWGVGDPTRTGVNQTGSWAFYLLPFIEQDNVYRAFNGDPANPVYSATVSIYHCPTRRPAIGYATDKSRTAIATMGKTDYALNVRILGGTGVRVVVTIPEITDGTSNTLLVGEKYLQPSQYTAATWSWDQPWVCGGGIGTGRTAETNLQDHPTLSGSDRWGSAHPGAAQFLFFDGSVRRITYNTNLRAFVTHNGGEVNPSLN
jgi:prepilin-type processing-associated H-X9-DG protein